MDVKFDEASQINFCGTETSMKDLAHESAPHACPSLFKKEPLCCDL